jgi:hypothetical protein
MGIVNIAGKRGLKIAEELRKKPGATYYWLDTDIQNA